MSRGVSEEMRRSQGWKWSAMAAMAAAVVACGSERKKEAPAPTAGAPSASVAAAADEAAKPAADEAAKSAAADEAAKPAAAAAVAAPPPAGPIPAQAHQLIVGVVDGWDAVPVKLARYERSADGGAWKAAGAPWTGVVGSGIAWGRGLHGDGPPAGQSGPQKQEGDGRSPAGVFSLNGSYGYAKAALSGARWPYTPVDASWHCVDDSASKVYGAIVDADDVAKDWSSSEKMRRKDALYTWVVDVAHNPAHVAKGGSCIFLHVWRDESSPTVGCTAMPQPALERVLTWLDPAAHPVYALLPSEAYAALATSWGLPAQ